MKNFTAFFDSHFSDDDGRDDLIKNISVLSESELEAFEAICKIACEGKILPIVYGPDSNDGMATADLGPSAVDFCIGSGAYVCGSYRPGAIIFGFGWSGAASAMSFLYTLEPLVNPELE